MASHEPLTNSRKNDLHQTPFEKKTCLKGIPSKEASHEQSPVKMKKWSPSSFLDARRFCCLSHTISILTLLQDSKCVARKACSVPVCMVSTDSPTTFHHQIMTNKNTITTCPCCKNCIGQKRIQLLQILC